MASLAAASAASNGFKVRRNRIQAGGNEIQAGRNKNQIGSPSWF
jgi:hypothetical protein